MTNVTAFAPYKENIEVRAIKSALTSTEFVQRGGRYHLFLLISGSGELLDADGAAHSGEVTTLAAPGLCWLPQGRAATVRLTAGSRGMALSIPDPELGRSMPSGPTGNRIREVIGQVLVARGADKDKMLRLMDLAQAMERELFEGGPLSHSVVQYSLALALIEMWRISVPGIANPLPLPRNIVHTFLALVDVHLRDHWTVQQYAQHIGVSKDRLNSAVRRATGKSPLAHIHARMVSEAKALLSDSALQVAEIGFMLGFTDAGYFNRFFQRQVGLPPGKFRHNAARMRAEADGSFAAWP